MGVFYRAGEFIGGISKELVDKIGSATLTTTAKDLSGAVNELKASKSDTDTMTTAYCTSEASATAKIAQCTGFSLKNNSYIPINFVNGNTAAQGSGVTLNINNTGAKPIYVDWSDNSIKIDQPFNAGTYILYYVSNAYYLFTNGSLYPYLTVARLYNLKYYSFTSSDSSVDITESLSTSGDIIEYLEDLSVKKVNGHTVNSDVPSNAVFTDTNDEVAQTTTSTDADYYVLLSGSSSTLTKTEGTNKSNDLYFNPSKKALTLGYRLAGNTVGTNSIALGVNTIASGNCSFAVGGNTTASGINSHAEGQMTVASGNGAHAEGGTTTASGSYSHSEGQYTIANHKSQHVFGEYNIADDSTAATTEKGNYIEIVGNGTSSSVKANARTLDWNGNEMLAGGLSLAGASSDINLTGTGNTWDGTNTSLKSAITDKWMNIKGITGTSKSTADTGNWVAMCKSSSTGSPTLPTADKWWHVLSLDCWKSGPTNWVSQLAIATQESSGVWWRRNSSSTSVDSASWTRLADANANGYANRALADGDGSTISSTYLKLSGGTLTGALNTANNTWNKIGDDVQIGDRNVAGGLGIQGLNGNTNITFYKYGDASNYASLRYDGSNFIFNKNLYCENYAVHQKRTAVTMGTSSNNGCTSYQEMNYYNVDNNNYWMTRMCTALETSGNVALHLQCRNTKTNGDVIQNNLALGVKKDGSRYVTLTDASVWRSALGLGSIATKNTGDYLPISGGTVTGTLILSRTTDASGTANNKPALIIGGTDTQTHIEIDNNEILAKNNGTTIGTLYLQDGGELHLCANTYAFDKGRLNFAKALTNSNVSAPNYVVGLTNSWGAFGYTALSALATTMLKVQETKISFKFSVALGAHSGMTFANARGSAFAVSVPSGYTLMCNVYCCANGFGGLWATLDGDVYTSTSPGIYLYNSSNSTLSTSTTVTVRVVSVFRKS